jgi:hypothetical protein
MELSILLMKSSSTSTTSKSTEQRSRQRTLNVRCVLLVAVFVSMTRGQVLLLKDLRSTIPVFVAMLF